MRLLQSRLRAAVLIAVIAAAGLLLTSCASDTGGGDQESLTLGEALYRLIVGGPSISEATLLRFYVWHVIALAIPMLALIVWHGFRSEERRVGKECRSR